MHRRQPPKTRGGPRSSRMFSPTSSGCLQNRTHPPAAGDAGKGKAQDRATAQAPFGLTRPETGIRQLNTRLGPGFEPGSGSSMNLRRFESPGNAARIAVLSADQAPTAIIGCPNMTPTTSPISKGCVSRCRFETLFFQPQGTLGTKGRGLRFLSYRNRRLGDAVAIPIGRRCVCRGRRHQYGDRESNESARVGRHR